MEKMRCETKIRKIQRIAADIGFQIYGAQEYGFYSMLIYRTGFDELASKIVRITIGRSFAMRFFD